MVTYPQTSTTLCMHPWITTSPGSQEQFLKSEFKRNQLLFRISTIAISIISLSSSIAAIFTVSKPAMLLSMGLALSSTLLFYFPSTFSRQAKLAEKNFFKMKEIRLELDKLKARPKDEIESELKNFTIHPQISWDCQLTVLARLNYLNARQTDLYRNISQLSTCLNIHDRKLKLWQRNRAWEIYTQEYLPTFVEKAFCYYLLKNPFYQKFPWEVVRITPKDFLEYSLEKKYQEYSPYLTIPHQNNRTLNLDEFENLTSNLLTSDLSAEIFSDS